MGHCRGRKSLRGEPADVNQNYGRLLHLRLLLISEKEVVLWRERRHELIRNVPWNKPLSIPKSDTIL